MRTQKYQNCDKEDIVIIEPRSFVLLNLLGWLHKKNMNKQRLDDFLDDGKLIKSLKKMCENLFYKKYKIVFALQYK